MMAPLPRLVGSYDLTFDAGWRAPRHVHAHVEEMLVITQGRLELEAGERFSLGAGSVVTYPRGRDHAEWNPGATPVRMICLLWEHGSAAEARRLPPVASDPSGRVRCGAAWLHELATQAGRQAPAVHGLLAALLGECLRTRAPDPDDRIARVCRHLEERFAEPIALEEMARIAGMTRYHFAHRFRAATNQTPLGYLRAVRIERARALLAGTTWTQARIAEETGFSDEFQLSRVFRRVTGLPPSAVRRGAARSARGAPAAG
jgi:AraC-like DNA-binding protein